MEKKSDKPRQRKWDKKHLRTVSTHLRAEEVQRLRMLCLVNCVTPYALLRDWLRAYIASGGVGR